MLAITVQAALAAPFPVRADFPANADPQPPFGHWWPTLPFERETADKLAWVNDGENNDFDSYPGEGWQDDDGNESDFEPTDEDIQALHEGELGDPYLSPDEMDAEFDHQAWTHERDAELADIFAELHGTRLDAIDYAELAECGLDPWGHGLPAAHARDCYAGGDWR